MFFFHSKSAPGARRVLFGSLLSVVLLFSACKSAKQQDPQAVQETMWFNDVPELQSLDVSSTEIKDLFKAHDAGLSDPACATLIKLARSRKVAFAEGQSVADLLSAGSTEQTVLELARLNQLVLWAGQARALRLAGFSDKIILAIARRRSQGLSVLTGEKLGELKNAGASDSAILHMVESGITDKEASAYIALRERAAGGHGFVYQGHTRRRD
jgi:hypothetical protein